MTRNSQIITVSVPIKFSEFLEEQNLSPSELLQQKIIEQITIHERFKSETGKQSSIISGYQKEISWIYAFLESKGIQAEEYAKWRGNFSNGTDKLV